MGQEIKTIVQRFAVGDEAEYDIAVNRTLEDGWSVQDIAVNLYEEDDFYGEAHTYLRRVITLIRFTTTKALPPLRDNELTVPARAYVREWQKNDRIRVKDTAKKGKVRGCIGTVDRIGVSDSGIPIVHVTLDSYPDEGNSFWPGELEDALPAGEE